MFSPPINKAAQCQQSDSTNSISYPRINEDKNTDVLIIGAGIEGLTTGLYLIEKGFRVIITERNGFIADPTALPETFTLFPAPLPYHRILKNYGPRNSKLLVQSHQQACKWIVSTIENKNIKCNLKSVNTFLVNTNSENKLDEEYKSARKLKIAAKFSSKKPGNGMTNEALLQYPKQYTAEVQEYRSGLAASFINEGGELYINSNAEQISASGAAINGYAVRAGRVIVTGDSILSVLPNFNGHQLNYCKAAIKGKVPKGSLPYGYYRGEVNDGISTGGGIYSMYLEALDSQHDMVYSNCEISFTCGDVLSTENAYQNLINWTGAHLQSFENPELIYCTMFKKYSKMLPWIGKYQHNQELYILSVNETEKAVQSAIGGFLISEMINGTRSKWQKIYAPFTTFSINNDTAKETSKISLEFARNWLEWDISQALDLAAGHGKVIAEGSFYRALYRNSSGKLNSFKVSCTHGTPFYWNADAHTFNCPEGCCYSPSGSVVLHSELKSKYTERVRKEIILEDDRLLLDL